MIVGIYTDRQKVLRRFSSVWFDTPTPDSIESDMPSVPGPTNECTSGCTNSCQGCDGSCTVCDAECNTCTSCAASGNSGCIECALTNLYSCMICGVGGSVVTCTSCTTDCNSCTSCASCGHSGYSETSSCSGCASCGVSCFYVVGGAPSPICPAGCYNGSVV